jgi:hypothetical protein
MASAHALDVSPITPAQVWAQVTAEQQQQIVRLLAHLAVQVIGAEAPWRAGPGHPLGAHQTAPRLRPPVL